MAHASSIPVENRLCGDFAESHENADAIQCCLRRLGPVANDVRKRAEEIGAVARVAITEEVRAIAREAQDFAEGVFEGAQMRSQSTLDLKERFQNRAVEQCGLRSILTGCPIAASVSEIDRRECCHNLVVATETDAANAVRSVARPLVSSSSMGSFYPTGNGETLRSAQMLPCRSDSTHSLQENDHSALLQSLDGANVLHQLLRGEIGVDTAADEDGAAEAVAYWKNRWKNRSTDKEYAIVFSGISSSLEPSHAQSVDHSSNGLRLLGESLAIAVAARQTECSQQQRNPNTQVGEVVVPSAVQCQALAVGSLVKVVVPFKSNSEDSVDLACGLRGVVCQIDDEGDALISFKDADEDVDLDEWVFSQNFGNLAANQALAVGAYVKVIEPFMSASEEPADLACGLHGIVCEIDDDGDARISFKDSETHVLQEEWVFSDDFGNLVVDQDHLETCSDVGNSLACLIHEERDVEISPEKDNVVAGRVEQHRYHIREHIMQGKQALSMGLRLFGISLANAGRAVVSSAARQRKVVYDRGIGHRSWVSPSPKSCDGEDSIFGVDFDIDLDSDEEYQPVGDKRCQLSSSWKSRCSSVDGELGYDCGKEENDYVTLSSLQQSACGTAAAGLTENVEN